MGKVYVIGRDSVPQSIRLGAGEQLEMTLLALPGCSADLSIEVDFEAPGASLDLAGLYLCRGDDKLNINIIVRHNAGGCLSRQLFKGIAGGKSRACFDGLIYVAHGAQKTKAYQESHTILLPDEEASAREGFPVSLASAEARPQLEIYADDVECSHGATTGFLNPDELFYMRSRGIPEAQARQLQILSFLSPVASRLSGDLQAEVFEAAKL